MTILMYRFVRRRGLSIVPMILNPGFHHGMANYLMHPPPGVPTKTYNVFAEHYKYNETDVMSVMPPDTVNIATIRQPLTQLKSVFPEFALVKKFEADDPDPVRTYLQNITRFGKNGLFGTKSLQLHEFGLEMEDIDNIDVIMKWIAYADEKFQSVIIAEYFEESMVLTKRKLCWDMQDIIYMTIRNRNYKHKSTLIEWDLIQKRQEFSKGDYLLYEYFVSKLFKNIGQEKYFWEEVGVYRTIQKKVSHNDSIVCQMLSWRTKN